MNWYVRMGLMTLLTVLLIVSDHIWQLPVLRLFMVWAIILWVGTAVRFLCHFPFKTSSPPSFKGGENRVSVPSPSEGGDGEGLLSRCWAVLQTFTFITFTRLFFRSGSNLDPATANQEAWETATNMVNQIGGAWNSSIIPAFLVEYRAVVLLFVAGMAIHWLPTKWKQWYRIHFACLPLWAIMVCVVVAVFVIYQFITADMQPFIYFQF